jgi:TPR repeat protein
MDDPRVPDLARWGCENGEPSGCYVLAKLHEEGRGVEKDEPFARSLYEMACPPTRASYAGQYGDYSPAACSRLAEIAEGGVMPPKERARAIFYAEYACRNPGSERDHSFCVKLAKYWTTGVLSQTCETYNADWCRNSARQAADVFYGPDRQPGDEKECQRPSVKAACDALESNVVAMKRPTTKKK